MDRIALFGIRIRFIFKTQIYSVFGPNLLFGPTLMHNMIISMIMTLPMPKDKIMISYTETELRQNLDEMNEVVVVVVSE